MTEAEYWQELCNQRRRVRVYRNGVKRPSVPPIHGWLYYRWDWNAGSYVWYVSGRRLRNATTTTRRYVLTERDVVVPDHINPYTTGRSRLW